jgi:hypothetical protein
MRLFSSWFFLFSDSDETTLGEVNEAAQSVAQPSIKQTVLFSDNGSATIAAGATYTISQAGATSTRQRLLDVSVNKNVYLKITQDTVLRTIELKGTTKLPARFVATLDAAVTAIAIESREATDDCSAEWLYCELSDIATASNFPAV